MEVPPYFTLLESHAEYRPTGRFTFDQVLDMVAKVVTWTREQHIRKLLIVATELTGLSAPSLGERYFFAQELAKASQGRVQVALVSRPEWVDSQKFGTTVARNRGASADIFVTEEEALAWLHGDSKP